MRETDADQLQQLDQFLAGGTRVIDVREPGGPR